MKPTYNHIIFLFVHNEYTRHDHMHQMGAARPTCECVDFPRGRLTCHLNFVLDVNAKFIVPTNIYLNCSASCFTPRRV